MKLDIFYKNYKSEKFLKVMTFFRVSSLFCLVLVFPMIIQAESQTPNEAVSRFFPASYVGSIFKEKFNAPIDVTDYETKEKKVEQELNKISKEEDSPVIEFHTSDISKKKFLPPDQTPSIAVNPDAPSSVISMIENNRRGDTVTAKAYAKQFVRTLQNYFFEVREITSLIGEALIEETAIKEDDWVGAQQAIDIELARTRLEKGVLIKPTQDVAMKRIVPDSKKEVEVFYFFSRACSYCRFMTPDVERVARAFAEDKRVKITGLVVGESDELWLNEFRSYTGLSIPVYDGTEFAHHLKLGFLPVLLVVTPNGNRSYSKSGQQTFERMYEFIRTAQGLPIEDSLKLQSIIKTPVGAGDKLLLASKKSEGAVVSESFASGKKALKVNLPSKLKAEVEISKF